MKNRQTENTDIYMYSEKIKDSKSAIHLGIVLDISGRADIEGKLSLGRKTAYSLMDAGSMGEQG